MGQRIIVCGGRDFKDIPWMNSVLDKIHRDNPITELIEGGAPGADALAASWAIYRKVPHTVYPAYWRKQGKAAGPIRNQRMIDEGQPDLVVAFPGGAGTADMTRRALAAKIPVLDVKKRETINGV